MALWGSRGWNTREEVRKTFHRDGLVAEVSFRHHGWTPLEVEGLTLEGIEFHKRGEYKPIPLAEVPPVLFSEVMRDCDLVVSVAHRGGVDPEASASTVDMRAALLRETADNLVRFRRITRPAHLRALLFGVRYKLFEILIQMQQRFVFQDGLGSQGRGTLLQGAD